jgi:hypothetical protein
MNRMGRKSPYPSSTAFIIVLIIVLILGFGGFILSGGMG